MERPGAQQWVPSGGRVGVSTLRRAAEACRGCELYQDATQVVFSSGPARARMVLVGEQPGDVEDREGEPFVGPAGRLLRKALAEAGLDAGTVYLTNAVKHFRFTPTRGRRRLHRTPDLAHLTACRPWLDKELAVVRPEVVVLLGATAAKAVYGSSFAVTRQRGVVMAWPSPSGPQAVATVHPSAVLRARDRRDEAFDGLVQDLAVAAAALG
ncbi:UdgX family uracil-DNA binding protein [Thalassiella azotivora]